MTLAPLPPAALNQIFSEAHTCNSWSDREVPEALVRQLYDLVKFAPTAFNSSPARFVWVRSGEGKATLASLASEGNRAKILAAPVTVIIGMDLDFADKLAELFPARGAAMAPMFKGTPMTEPTAFRNATLQGAYLVLAARALGLDTGPMSGFNNAAVDEAFFAGTAMKSNFICSLGYRGEDAFRPRNPRLAFEDAGRFA